MSLDFIPDDMLSDRIPHRPRLSDKNEERADSAMIAMQAFIDHCHMNDEELRTQMGDLLVDLQHLAFSKGLDWAELVQNANASYAQEIDSTCRTCGAAYCGEEEGTETICGACEEEEDDE